MSTREIEIVRSLTDAFSEVDFLTLREALAHSETMDELAASAGELGRRMRDLIDREVEIHLHDIDAALMLGREFSGWPGWIEFWRGWLEPWDDYSVGFSRWEELGDVVVYELDVEARGRGSGVEVTTRITQAWTVDRGKVTRLGMYGSRRKALADLGRG